MIIAVCGMKLLKGYDGGVSVCLAGVGRSYCGMASSDTPFIWHGEEMFYCQKFGNVMANVSATGMPMRGHLVLWYFERPYKRLHLFYEVDYGIAC